MDKVDWSKAPEWADRALLNCNDDWLFSDGVRFITTAGGTEYHDRSDGNGGRWLGVDDFKAVKMRPDNWKEGEKRMEPIGQNGNEGEHYAELDNFDKQPRYKGDDGLDWIDEFARDNSIEDFRAAMRFTIGKYEKRLGKKDAMSKELYKMSDYYKRWSEAEKKLEDDK